MVGITIWTVWAEADEWMNTWKLKHVTSVLITLFKCVLYEINQIIVL